MKTDTLFITSVGVVMVAQGLAAPAAPPLGLHMNIREAAPKAETKDARAVIVARTPEAEPDPE